MIQDKLWISSRERCVVRDCERCNTCVSVGCKYYKSAQETQTGLKGMIKAKIVILLSFIHLHVIPNCIV